MTRTPTRTTSAWSTWLTLPVASGLCFVSFIAVLGIVLATGGVDLFDTTVRTIVVAGRGSALTAVATAVTTLGSFPVLVGAAGLTAAALVLQDRRLDRALFLLGGMAVGAGTVYLVKVAVARPRPATGQLLGSPSSDYSFPSGHTGNGTITWVLVAVLLTVGARAGIRRLAVVAAIVLSASIGFSRVYLGYHWASDVIAGWLLAAAVICLALTVRETMSPHNSEPPHNSDQIPADPGGDRPADDPSPYSPTQLGPNVDPQPPPSAQPQPSAGQASTAGGRPPPQVCGPPAPSRGPGAGRAGSASNPARSTRRT